MELEDEATPVSLPLMSLNGNHNCVPVPPAARWPVDQGWQFRQLGHPDYPWRTTAGFPTEIFRDLQSHELLDPFMGTTEKDVQWVGERRWAYRTRFRTDRCGPHGRYRLMFEGLDTFATVRVNGNVVLRTSNMFTPYSVDVTETVKYADSGPEMLLEVEFESAWLVGKKLVEQHPSHRWGCSNGDPSRCAVRKAQYHYGWDWGPKLMTCGPWKPIYLEAYNARIGDLWFDIRLEDDLKSAQVRIAVEFEGEADQIDFQLGFEGMCVAHVETVIERAESSASAFFLVKKPHLWYPFRYGDQALYTVKAVLKHRGQVRDEKSKRLAIRKTILVQRALKATAGTSFTFEINNIPIFCGGSNWIPAHSFQTALTPQKYTDWIRMAVDSNQVMIRVWGGGIYEHDAFYDACDDMGVLVWQDFMFACGNYPVFDQFLASVKQEAISNVKRMRHHPCIVLWAGNNEDYAWAESEGLEYDPEDNNVEQWLKSSFPARYIYERLLPDVVEALMPDVCYHNGSPFGGRKSSEPTIGDIHQWNMWHGTQVEYQKLDQLSGRFVSEFGMEAFPDMRTLDAVLPIKYKKLERYPQSAIIEFHNKAAGNERRLATYLAENIRYTLDPFEQYVYCTQLIQSEAIGTAYRLWKRQWKGPGREYCSGALVWQMNDCWPAISWSLVDHYFRPKLAYFALKREMQPITIGMRRVTKSVLPEHEHTRPDQTLVTEVELWIANLTLQEHHLSVSLVTESLVTDAQGKVSTRRQAVSLSDTTHKQILTISPNRTTEIGKIVVTDNPRRRANQTIVRAHARSCISHSVTVLESSRQPPAYDLLAEAYNWPEPLKHVHLPKPSQLHISLLRSDSVQAVETRIQRSQVMWPSWWRPPNRVCIVSIETDVPLKAVAFEIERSGSQGDWSEEQDAEVVFDDQGFDMLAHEKKYIFVWGLNVGEEKRLSVRYLGMTD